MGTMDREEEPCRPEGKTSNRRGVFSVADENAFSTFSTLNNVIRTFKKKRRRGGKRDWIRGDGCEYSLYLLGPSSRQKVRVKVASSSKNSVANASHQRLSLSCNIMNGCKDVIFSTSGRAIASSSPDEKNTRCFDNIIVRHRRTESRARLYT